ncbi:MAG TPA: hypothetical protein PKD20_04760 [Candidatus Saccharibacteria bacterium]|jgi:hypothetical protein|nr:hypothetical protein [Candidatus Saccharibacteria bacterium]HMT56156.1 hypothetical protein [Candidatus Saccharibacteria bacterium]
MSESVIVRVTEPHEKALIKNRIFALGERLSHEGDSFDMNSTIPNTAINGWWQGTILAHGADSGEVYYGRPGLWDRYGNSYKNGVLLSVIESVSTASVVFRSTPAHMPPLCVGKVWEPVGEVIEKVVVQNSLQIHHPSADLPAELAELPRDTSFRNVDSILRGTHGMDAMQLATAAMQFTISWGKVVRS